MTSLRKHAKSKGIVAIVRDTDTIKYSTIAEKTLPIASDTLGMPFTVINVTHGESTMRYDSITDSFIEWKNTGRFSVYDTTPYDTTVVIDVDYLMYVDCISTAIALDGWDYMLTERAISMPDVLSDKFSSFGLSTVWATVFAFKKTRRSALFFELVQLIQYNWDYYRHLYMIEQSNFRNDHAFRIADSIMNGYSSHTKKILPELICHVTEPIRSLVVNNDSIHLKTTDVLALPRMNLHIYDKQFLQSERFVP